MELRLSHALEPADAEARLAAAALSNGLELERTAALSGRVEKRTPLGSVRGRYRVEPGAVVVVVEERPALLPEGAVRRAVEDALGSALRSSPTAPRVASGDRSAPPRPGR